MTLRSRLRALAVRVLDRVEREPVLVIEVAKAAIAVAVAFGLPLGDEQRVAVIGLVYTVLTLVARQSVTPTRKARRAPRS